MDALIFLSTFVCMFLTLQYHEVKCEAYYGKYIDDFTTYYHGVRGKLYAASNNKLFISGFYYDGSAPDAFAWMGSTNSPSSAGQIIPVNGSSAVLGGHSDSLIQLDLPEGSRLSEYKWISIWCRAYTANFGEIIFPSNIETPAELSLGALGFTRRVHNVYADDVIIINHRQIRIVNLDYDGGGPDAYYWAGTGGSPSRQGFALIDDSRGSAGPIPRSAFNNKTLVVTFPAGKTIFDIGHFGVWCDLANQDFGHVDIPAELNVPVYEDPVVAVPTTPTPQDPVVAVPTTPTPQNTGNCEVLIPDMYHVSWTIAGSMIEITLSGRVKPGNYLAFGISGSTARTTMIGSDVTVAWLDAETGARANAVDYYLSQYGQCIVGDGPGAGTGACPDEVSQPSGTDDVTVMDYSNINGIITISYTRPLNTGDTNGDKVIPTDQEVYIAWSVGPINPAGLAAKHRQQPATNFKINFGRESSSCPAFTEDDQSYSLDPWENVEIGGVGLTSFVADMGQAGGQQGYEGITGSPGWGIAWYINNEIIPILTLKRGVTYTFEVNGGNDPGLSAAYHPFYITNDSEGGYAQKSTAEKQGVEIYAGPESGSLCEWRSVGLFNPDSYGTFNEYRDQALERQCDGSNPATLTWTPNEDTPDRVYYQCYTHKFLGWKINIVDEYPEEAGRTLPPDGDPSTQVPSNGDTSTSTSNSARQFDSTMPATTAGGVVPQGSRFILAILAWCLYFTYFI